MPMYPKSGKTYSLFQIEKELELRDIPSLNFKFGRYGTIQLSHLTSEQLLSIPLFPETLWVYERETFEWIPIFHYSNENKFPISRFLNLEVDLENEKIWWATPVGFPREQYRSVYHD